MNCDTAFDLMTDAGGCQSAALALHLRGCPRCRQMQETLAPALGFVVPTGWGASAHELAGAKHCFDFNYRRAGRNVLAAPLRYSRLGRNPLTRKRERASTLR